MRCPARAIGATIAAVAAALAVPAAASAVTCDYSSAAKSLTVTVADADAHLSVVGGEIKVAHSYPPVPVTCTGPGGPPTVTNTGGISVTGGTFERITIHEAAAFGPGPDPQDLSDGPGSSKEIEIFVNLGAGSALVVETGDGGGVMALGTGGINPNIAGEVGPRDADIISNGQERIVLHGGSGSDELRARGGSGTGGVVTEGIELDGNGGTNLVEGGDGPDVLLGGPGTDIIFGGGGDDTISPGSGNDTANGAGGTDTFVLTPSGALPVAVDFAITGAQDTGQGSDFINGFENAWAAGDGPATLRGDDGPNVLTSAGSDDALDGRGGADTLNAGAGADTLEVRDGERDTADCGAGADTVTADAPGIDLLTGCETAIFPPLEDRAPPAPPEGGGPPARPADGVPPAPTAATFGPRILVTLALARRRVGARGPLAVQVENRNGFDVRGSLSGRTSRPVQRARRVRLAAKSFVVRGNARRTVSLRLPEAVRRHLSRKGTVSLRLTAVVRDPAGSTRSVTKTLKPRLKRPARG